MVSNVKDLELLLMHNRKYCAEIAHNVSTLKRKAIVERAAEVRGICSAQLVAGSKACGTMGCFWPSTCRRLWGPWLPVWRFCHSRTMLLRTVLVLWGWWRPAELRLLDAAASHELACRALPLGGQLSKQWADRHLEAVQAVQCTQLCQPYGSRSRDTDCKA